MIGESRITLRVLAAQSLRRIDLISAALFIRAGSRAMDPTQVRADP
jgi:hypothetical protein